jgi:signal transduction histidine kinase
MASPRIKLPSSEGLVGRFLIACMTVGFLAVLAAGAAAVIALQRNERHNDAVNHTYRVEAAISQLRQGIEQTETARRGYILTSAPRFLTTWRDAHATLGPRVRAIAVLVADNPRQRATLRPVGQQVALIAAQQEATNALIAARDPRAALLLFRAQTASQPIVRIRALFDAMNREEQRLMTIRDAEQVASRRIFYIVSAVAGALVLLLAAVSFLTVRRYTGALATSRDTLARLNATLEDQVDERTADLSRANEEIQRFAYIVSHDLRSPLVNVMGFTAELEAATVPLNDLVDRAERAAPEILTEDARVAARADLPEAIGFIRTSTQKMDRLINAILKLSREGRRVISPETLNLEQVSYAVIGAIQHVLEDRGVSVTVASPMPTIVSDRLAVEQILSNLVENASKYLKPGRPGEIMISGRQDRGRVVIAVADNGRGIAPSDHQRIFDLFRRSGTQDQPGEGIGLAHVRALAYRLGGTIDVSSELGTGSTFRVILPPRLEMQDQRP